MRLGMFDMSATDELTIATTQGNPRDPLLIFLHGGGATRYVWTPHLDQLADDYRVIAADLPGHGHHPETTFSYNATTATLKRVLDAESGDAVVVGHSLGGYATLTALDQIDDRVQGVCLAGAGLNWRDIPVGLVQSTMVWSLGTLIRVTTSIPRLRQLVENQLPEPDYDVTQTPPDDADIHDELAALGQSMQAAAFTATWPAAEATATPLCIVCGTDAPSEAASQELATRTNTDFQRMKAEGHNAPVEAPEEFTSILQSFAETVFTD